MTGLHPAARAVRREIAVRAAWIAGVIGTGGLVGGYPWWMAGTVIGYFAAAGNLMLMTASLGRALGQDAWRARAIYLIFSFVRLLVLAGSLLLLIKWRLDSGLGFCAGLLTVMVAAGSGLVLPFNAETTKREEP